MRSSNEFIQLLKHTSFHYGKVVFAIICSTLNKICDIVPEILIGISIDTIVNQHNSLLSKLIGLTNPYHQIYVIGGITALFWIFESIFEYLYSITWHSIAQDIQHQLRLQSYATIQNLDLAYFENTTTGGLLHTLQNDIDQLQQFLKQAPNEVIQLTVNILVMGTIFFYLSPTLALLTLLPIPFVVGIAYYFQHKLADLYEKVRQTSNNLSGHIAQRLQGITTIKSYTTESYELALLENQSALYRTANKNANHVNAEYIPIVRMAIMIGFIVSLVIGGMYTLQGIIPINWYAALVFLTQRFLWPFTNVSAITDMYEQSLASAKRILSILESKPTIEGSNNPLNLDAIASDITFNHVSFAYNNGIPILQDINFVIPAQKTIAFVGATGSGKSTIIKHLLRFYDATNGTIYIGNHDIKSLPLSQLRSIIGLVSQDIYLVDGTIADNIAYGSFKASKEEIIAAAKMAHAHDFIMKLSDGYDTKVQENGKNLSGGQKQRLAIARAIIKKAPILIFDEATSAVDNETEAAIQKSLNQIRANHTIIIIAHRLSTVRNADTIFVLDKGKIIESGKHEELLMKEGAYANLWNTQF